MAVEKHALNKKERALMHVLLNLAEKNDEGVCLVKPLEIFEALPYDYAYTPEDSNLCSKGLRSTIIWNTFPPTTTAN